VTGSFQAAGDVCTAKSAVGADGQHPTLVLVTCIFASSLAFVDGSVVNVALPAIGRSLATDAASLQWVINAYLLPLGALLLLGGAVGDRFGRRAVLVIGVAVFAAGSALCAVAKDLDWLLAARALQGAGGALLLPNSLAILGSMFSGTARGRAVGIWSAASSITSAAGPVLGGWLIDRIGWRAVFLVNVPLALAAIILALAVVHNPPGEERKPPLDVTGALAATASLLALTWGLTAGSGPHGWSDEAILATGIGRRSRVVVSCSGEATGRAGDDAARLVRLERIRRADVADASSIRGAGCVVRGRAIRADRRRGILGDRGRRSAAAVSAGAGIRLTLDGQRCRTHRSSYPSFSRRGGRSGRFPFAAAYEPAH
jgi:hypothetical protein